MEMSNLLVNVLLVLFLSIIPISEVRGAIPYGILIAKLNPALVFVVSTLGNLMIIYPLLATFNNIENFLLKKFRLRQEKGFLEKILSKYFYFTEKARRKVNPYIDRYGVMGLTIYTFIPLPFTGAWTATLAAHILGMKRKTAFLSVGLGVVLASLLVFSMVFLGVSIELFI